MPAAQYVHATEQTFLAGSPFTSVSSLLRHERRRGLLGTNRSSEAVVGPVRHHTTLRPPNSCRRPRFPLTATVPPGEEHGGGTKRTSDRRPLHQSSRNSFLGWLYNRLENEPEWKRRQHLNKDKYQPRDVRDWDKIIAKSFEYSQSSSLTADQIIANIRNIDSHCGWTNNFAWTADVHRRLNMKYPQQLVKQPGGHVTMYSPLPHPAQNTAQMQGTKAGGSVAAKTRNPVVVNALPVSRRPAAVPKAANAAPPPQTDQTTGMAQQAQVVNPSQPAVPLAYLSEQQQVQRDEQMARIENLARQAGREWQLMELRKRHEVFESKCKRAAKALDVVDKFVVKWSSRDSSIASDATWRIDLAESDLHQLQEFVAAYRLLGRVMEPIAELGCRYDELVKTTYTELVSSIAEIRWERHQSRMARVESMTADVGKMRSQIDQASNHWKSAVVDGVRFRESLIADMDRAFEWEEQFKFLPTSFTLRSLTTFVDATRAVTSYCEDCKKIDFWNNGKPLFRMLDLKWVEGHGPARMPLKLACCLVDLEDGMNAIGALFHIARGLVRVQRDLSRSPAHRTLFAPFARKQRLHTTLSLFTIESRQIHRIAWKTRLHRSAVGLRPKAWTDIAGHQRDTAATFAGLRGTLEAFSQGYYFPHNGLETFLAGVMRPLLLASVNIQSLSHQASQLRKAINGSEFSEEKLAPVHREMFHAYNTTMIVLGTCWFLRDSLGLRQRSIPYGPMPETRQLMDNFLSYEPQTSVTAPKQVAGSLGLPKALQLYPLGERAVPVHYVFEGQSIDQALADFGRSDVVGLDVISASKFARTALNQAQFISIATEERVVVLGTIDIRDSRSCDVAVRYSRLIDILCNPKICKVGLDMPRVRRELEMLLSCEGQGFHDLDLDRSGSWKAHLKGPATLAAVKVLKTPVNPYGASRPGDVLKLLATRPLASLKLFRDRSGRPKDVSADIVDSSPTCGRRAALLTMGPVHFERTAVFVAHRVSGLTDRQRIQQVERVASLRVLARDFAVDLFVNCLHSPHRESAMEILGADMDPALVEQILNQLRARRSHTANTELWKAGSFRPWIAYCLATTFNEPVTDIGEWLQLNSPARSILRLVDAVHLPLRPHHRHEFEQASQHEPVLAEIRKPRRKENYKQGLIYVPPMAATLKSRAKKKQTKEKEQKERRKKLGIQMLKSADGSKSDLLEEHKSGSSVPRARKADGKVSFARRKEGGGSGAYPGKLPNLKQPVTSQRSNPPAKGGRKHTRTLLKRVAAKKSTTVARGPHGAAKAADGKPER